MDNTSAAPSSVSSTIHVDNLIKTIVRAFYTDDCVCIIDVLLRDKYLRDDDMGPRLSLPVKQLRRTMEYLHREMLVRYELVDDLAAGGSQQTKFWYVDYNHCVNVIRWRVFKLKQQIAKTEVSARSSSSYVCPNYRKKVCNGTYSELEAQQVLDYETGLFLCQECVKQFANHPEPPPKSSYTLEVIDSSKELKLAMENAKRINDQFSSRRVGNMQLRYGIYDLLQKIRKTKGPLSSNLPSENFALGIGTTRLEGTGRTAGIKAKKLAQQQGEIGLKAMQDRAKRNQEGRSDLFKNAMGEEISFILEKGSGKRAFALASRKCDNGIIDADFGVFFMRRLEYRDREVPKVKKLKADTKFKVTNSSMPPFLINNISRTQQEMNLGKIDMSEKVGHVDESDTEEAPENLLTPERRVVVQDLYSKELSRQKALLGQVMPVLVSDTNHYSDDDDEDKGGLHWEDG